MSLEEAVLLAKEVDFDGLSENDKMSMKSDDCITRYLFGCGVKLSDSQRVSNAMSMLLMRSFSTIITLFDIDFAIKINKYIAERLDEIKREG